MKSVLLFLILFLPASAVYAQTPAQWQLTPDLRIGSINDATQALTRIGAVSTRPDGSIFITQPRDLNIRVYDARGRYSRTIGRPGDGPGEFQSLGAHGWRGDTLYVGDYRQRRLTLMSADGDVFATLPVVIPTTHPYLSGGVMRMLEDGTVLVGHSVSVAAISAGRVTSSPVLRADRIGTVLDTVFRMPLGATGYIVPLGNGRVAPSKPFPAAALHAISDDGVVVVRRDVADDADEGQFRVHWITFEGDTLLARSYRYSPKPVTAAVVEELVRARVATHLEAAERLGATRATLENGVRAGLDAPRFMPPITAVAVSSDGETWLRREDLHGIDTVQWNVLGRTGNVLAVFPLPKPFRPLLIDGDTAYGVETDQYDVEYLVRYRIDRAPHP